MYPVFTTLLRVLSAGEHLDERQHCFTLQIATENSSFPPNGARQQPITFYLNTETRQELIKVETSWTKSVTSAVKQIKVNTFTFRLHDAFTRVLACQSGNNFFSFIFHRNARIACGGVENLVRYLINSRF